MPALKDIVTSLSLGDGENCVVKYDPSAQIGERPGRNPGSTTYTIPVLLDGRMRHLSGGARLVTALQEAVENADLGNQFVGLVTLIVTAHGPAGTLQREWDIQVKR